MPAEVRNRFLITVYLFALGMIAMFTVFLSRYPVILITPQIARLRYYACQNGIVGGPLSSSLSEFDCRKAFVWRASDTEYRQRQLSQFFEVLTPRLYTHLYYWFGPFMWLPLCLLCTFIIGFMITLLVRQWCENWLPGLVAGSFWLMTSEALIGHHSPVRYAKDFVTLQILGIISLLLALRKPGRVYFWVIGTLIAVIWWAGLFTDEYFFFIFPAFAVAILSLPWLRRIRWPLLITIVILTAVGIWLYLVVLPSFITPDYRQPFPVIKLRQMSAWEALLSRNLKYLVINTWDNLTYTFGASLPQSRLQIIIAAVAGVFLLLTVILTRAWKGCGRMMVFWLITVGFVGGVLLPEGTDILHQIAYYNRPLIALMLVVFGLMTSRVLEAEWRWFSICWLGCLTICALLNFYAASVMVQNDPEDSNFTRYGVTNILQLHDRLISNDLQSPVFVSYPRFRDIVNGVYDELEATRPYTLENGFPWSMYRSIMPRLYLRHFEEGELLANPKQFARWIDTDEHSYRALAKYFYDMPAGVVWNLDDIKEMCIAPSVVLKWIADDGRTREAPFVMDLLGRAPFGCIEGGSWCATIPLPADGGSYELVFSLRHEGPITFTVKNAFCPEEATSSYRWAWRLFSVKLKPGADMAVLKLKTKSGAEIIGPLIVPAQAVASIPPSLRKNIPPAGIPLLDLRGSE